MVLINTFKGNENQILKKKYVEGKSLEVHCRGIELF